MRRLLVVVVALLLPLALLPGTASADPPIGPAEHWGGSFPPPDEDPDPIACQVGEDEEDVVLFSEESTFHGKDLTFRVDDGTGQAFLARNNWWFRAEHENLDNGVGFTVQGHGVFKELTGELVGTWDAEAEEWTAPDGWDWPLDENDDPVEIVGPVYRFTAIEVAHMTIRDERGRLIETRQARILWSAEFDTLGDSQPGGEFLREDEPVVLSGSFPFFDFCEVALDVTT